MLRSKLGLIGLCAMVLGVMALSASAAQAHLFEWLILNSTKTASSELKAPLVAEKDSEHITLLTKISGTMISITCTNLALVGVNLELGGTLTEGGQVLFENCEAYAGGALGTALECEIHSPETAPGSGDILTLPGKGGLVLHTLAGGGTELLTKLEPLAGPTGAFAHIEALECALPEVNEVHGVLYIKDCELKAEVHAVKHLIEQGALTSLWVGADTAEHLETSIIGSAWVKLGGATHTGLEWAGKHNLP